MKILKLNAEKILTLSMFIAGGWICLLWGCLYDRQTERMELQLKAER